MAISLELIWFRVLEVVLISNAYTFAHLLAFILFGYAVGSVCGSRLIERISNPRRVFLWVQGVVALYSVSVIWLIAWVVGRDPYGVLFSSGRGWSISGYLFLPAAMLLPPNILIGFCFPVVQKAIQTDVRFVAQRIGLVQASSIVGNVLGSVLTGLLMLDFWGTTGSLRTISALGLMFALVFIWENFSVRGRSRKMIGGLLALALLLLLFVFSDTKGFWAQLHRVRAGDGFIVAEDAGGVAALIERNDATTLYGNGHSQGKIPYTKSHTVLGILPALIHPDPKQVMVIGVGSSGTSFAVGINPRTEHIVVAEILASEVAVLKAYAERKGEGALKVFFGDNRYEIIITDGRRELAVRDAQFDIIEADTIHPWRSQGGLLYSKEFFEEVRAKLAKGGIMAQWCPTKRVEATFLRVFPYVLKFPAVNILIGSNEPILYDPQIIFDHFEKTSHFTDYLNRGEISFDYRSEEWLSKGWTLDTLRISDDVNTDLFPKDEYYLNNR